MLDLLITNEKLRIFVATNNKAQVERHGENIGLMSLLLSFVRVTKYTDDQGPQPIVPRPQRDRQDSTEALLSNLSFLPTLLRSDLPYLHTSSFYVDRSLGIQL